MKNAILDISRLFLSEAANSPCMLEDMAALEKYLVESYDGRTFAELLQNSDDAESSKVCIYGTDEFLVVANNGRPFNESDIKAICRSGASEKNRGETIGYRGVGFKSTASISNEILIFSSGVGFTFSKQAASSALNKPPERVPTVRVPFLVNADRLDPEIKTRVSALEKDGYTTAFVFMEPNLEKFESELKEFDAGWLLFLRNLEQVNISTKRTTKSVTLLKTKISDHESMAVVPETRANWYLVSAEHASIAFRYDSSRGIIPCTTEESVFHCYLPTAEKTGMPFKVNADFSTDPSRKHIVEDAQTKLMMGEAQTLLSELVQKAVMAEKPELYSLVSLSNTHNAIGGYASKFDSGFLSTLRKKKWIPLHSGTISKPEDAWILPGNLSREEKGEIAETEEFLHSPIIAEGVENAIPKLSGMIKKLGATEVTFRDLSILLLDETSSAELSKGLLAKLFAYCYRISDFSGLSVSSFYVPTNSGYVRAGSLMREQLLDEEFLNSITEILSDKEIKSLELCFEGFGLAPKAERSCAGPQALPVAERFASITNRSQADRWKTPVQNCIAIETEKNRYAKKAQKNRDGVDVLSSDANGEVHYIVVKTVGNLGDSFALSDSEYSKAVQHGEQFQVYLFSTYSKNMEYLVIVNPLKQARVKKVIKDWEWVFEKYDYQAKQAPFDDECTETRFNKNELDEMSGVEFEQACVSMLAKAGFIRILKTKASGDQGIDILAEKDGVKYGFQCKHSAKDVGNSAIQEACAGIRFYDCNIGIVITNRWFTRSAIELAKASNIVLWNRDMLDRLCEQ